MTCYKPCVYWHVEMGQQQRSCLALEYPLLSNTRVKQIISLHERDNYYFFVDWQGSSMLISKSLHHLDKKKRFIREFNDINLLSMSVFLKLCQIRGHKSTIAYCELTSIKTECCFHLMVIFIYNIYLWILVSTLLCITIYLLFPLLIHGVFHFANALQTSFHWNKKKECI